MGAILTPTHTCSKAIGQNTVELGSILLSLGKLSIAFNTVAVMLLLVEYATFSLTCHRQSSLRPSISAHHSFNRAKRGPRSSHLSHIARPPLCPCQYPPLRSNHHLRFGPSALGINMYMHDYSDF